MNSASTVSPMNILLRTLVSVGGLLHPFFGAYLSAADPSASSGRPSQAEAEIMAKIVCLPPHDEALRIARLYFKNASFMQAPPSSFLLASSTSS